jgi:protoporphyrinogen oxidase
MGSASVIDSLGESRPFHSRHNPRIAIIGGGLLGTTLALRYRQAGRVVTVFEAAERVERRGHASVASRDRSLLSLLDELDLSTRVRWDGPRSVGLRFGELGGGRGRIVETLRDRARALDVDFRLGTPVESVTVDGGLTVRSGGEATQFDGVVVTVPSPVASQILPCLPDRERLELLGVGYVGIINVAFVLARRPGERYISHVTRGRDHFAVVDPTALAPLDEERRAVVYVTRPLAANDELFEASDRHVIEHFARALPGNSIILSARVVRMPHAFAQRQEPTFKTSIAGLSIVNAAHMGGGRHHLERTAALATTVFRSLCAEHILVS